MSQRKRRNGSGNIYLRPDGLWQVQVTRLDGTRPSRYVRGKREDAEKLLHEMLQEVERGAPVAVDKLTLRGFLDRWLSEVVAQRVRPRTLESYTQLLRNHVTDTLGATRLTKVRTDTLQFWLNDCLESGLSPRSVAYLRSIVVNAFNQAIAWEMLTRNPAKFTDPPKQERRMVKPITPTEAAAILASVKGDRLEALVAVALSLGLRKAEALGLRWEDIDLDHGVLSVNGQIQRINKKLVRVPVKTDRSHRLIPIPSALVDQLKRHKQKQREERIASTRWDDPNLVFCTPVGSMLDGGNVWRWFNERLVAAKLERMRFHDLRHGCVSLLIAQGVHPRVIQEILGHSSISVTMDIYSHILPSTSRDALEAMSNAIVEKVRKVE